MILIASLLMSCGALLCDAQTATVVETLPDGGYVVEINGQKFRAITDEQRRLIEERRIRLAAAEEELGLADTEIGKLRAALELALKDAELASAQTTIQAERAGRFEAMFNGEHALRLQAEALAPRGRITRFFDNPVVQFAVKLGVPVIGAAIAARR